MIVSAGNVSGIAGVGVVGSAPGVPPPGAGAGAAFSPPHEASTSNRPIGTSVRKIIGGLQGADTGPGLTRPRRRRLASEGAPGKGILHYRLNES
jgi:hypothetical protein